MKKILATALSLLLVFAFIVPEAGVATAQPAYGAAGGAITGDGIYVEVDEGMSMAVYRIEKDGAKTLMTQKPAPIVPTAFAAAIQTAWAGKLPWSVGTGTGNDNFNNGSAKLLSDSSGYVTTGARSTGAVTGNEVAVDDFIAASATNETGVATYFGPGDRLTVTGKSETLNLTRILVIETSYRNPGVVSITSKYRYDGAGSLAIARFVENNYKIYDPLPPEDYLVYNREAGLWTQQGAALVHGRDYTMPVFNTMGLRNTTAINGPRCAANDLLSRNNWFWGENGGLPFNDFYGTNVGILIGSAMPHQIRGMELPTRGSGIADQHDTAYTWVGWPGQTLETGVLTAVGTSIVGVHTGDFYQANRQFSRAMAYIPSLVETGIGMESSVPADWLALPDTALLPDDAWMNTWESWGGNEGFEPARAMDWADDGTFASMGIKYLILDAGWYPRGTIARGGATMEMCQRGGEGLYIVQPYKWKNVADRLGMPCETEADAMKVVKAYNQYLNAKGFKVCAWVMPSSVFLFPTGDDGGWSADMNVTFAQAGATRDPSNSRNLNIKTAFTEKWPDFLITANAAEYDPVTGQLKEGSPAPYYVRQCGYYPQSGTGDLCLGNPKVMTEYVDYFCTLMFDTYGFDGLKIDTQWGTQACYALGHGHDGHPEAGIENYALFWKKIYEGAKAIKGTDDIWIKHCCCGTQMNFFNNNGTNRPIAGDAGSVAKRRYSNRMWKGLYGDNAPAVSDSASATNMKNLMGAGLVLETMMWGTLPAQSQRDFYTMSVAEGLSSGNYMDLYKFGFDYPEAYAFDKPERNTKYYSFMATRNAVSSYTAGSNNNPSNTLTYSGPVELRGLEPGIFYQVTEYVDNTLDDVLQANADGIITLDVAFTECILLKTVPIKAVYANLYADAESDIDGDVCYTLSISKAEDVLLVELEFEVDGNMLAGKGIDTGYGFLPMDNIFWSYAGGGMWKGTVTLSLPSGSTTGLTSEAPVDIATFAFAPRAVGDAVMKLTGFRAVGLEDTTVYLESVILNGEAVTNVDQRVFSKYDLNRDNKVDALDLGIMLLYCGFATGTPGWDTLVKVNDSRGKAVTASM
ncbi:MAG: hypothetical protein FWG53_01245, partial [Clostridiales bacterium]|nr:hypothetical protein [Clostridiales bacterium]